MSLDERVSELIKRIYCAGHDSSHWDRVALDVLQLTGAHAGLTSVTDLKSRDLTSYRAYGPEDSKFADGMNEYAHTYAKDPSLRWGFDNPDARFCDSANTLPAAGYLDNDYVKWNRDRFGSTHWYVAYTPPADDLSFAFSVHFPAAQGPADECSLRLFRMLFDHMECAVRLRRRPFDPNSARSLLLLDGTGRVQGLTAAAERLTSQAGAISIVGGRLSTAIAREQPKLDAALARAIATAASGASRVAFKATHPFGRRPWLVTVTPLLESFGPFGHLHCELLIEIHDGIPPIGSLDVLQSLFDLTARELQVVRLIADGHSVESLAECMTISVNTARAHLRAIFSKTGTVRQSQLVQLCAGLQQR